MRSNAVLMLFRYIAVLLMLLGVLQFVAILFMVFNQGAMQQVFAGQGGEEWLALLLMWPSQLCGMPLITFALGAILFVQVEIALRSGRPRDDA
jgi:hypothetical protein